MTTSRTRKTTATSSAAKKSAAKKASATKASAKKSSASTAKKSTANQSDPDDVAESDRPAPRKRVSAPRAAAQPKPKAAQIARDAANQLRELTGKDVEGITGFNATDDGWTVEVEVLEVRRIPNTTDILALYEVTVDESGALEGYRRQSRYARGVAREG